MNILVTGAAGFIGSHLTHALLNSGATVVGIDNLNNYYDPKLKLARLELIKKHPKSSNYQFSRLDVADREQMKKLFNSSAFDVVVNLAAQAGVRYSIENPAAYVDSNLVGFVNILEGCKQSNVKHLIYASSSSVYGMNTKQPFSPNDRTDYPISLYAATKKSNELMAYTYSHLFNLPCTGLRFFTVYGPWGRPDMAYYKFTDAILNERLIEVYNNGQMLRDFTYIDDIISGILEVLKRTPNQVLNPLTNTYAPYKLYNIGNNQPITLRRFITAIEASCGKKAIEKNLPMQPGDVPATYADLDELINDTGFKPFTTIEDGIMRFVTWYKQYHRIEHPKETPYGQGI